MRALRAVASGVLATLGVWLLAAGWLVGVGLTDRYAPADLIVVPGNTVAPDGTPSQRLQARLDAALFCTASSKRR